MKKASPEGRARPSETCRAEQRTVTSGTPPAAIARRMPADKHGMLMSAMPRRRQDWHDVCPRQKKGSTAKGGAIGRNLSIGGVRGRRIRLPPEWVKVEGGGTTGPRYRARQHGRRRVALHRQVRICASRSVSATTCLEWQLCAHRTVKFYVCAGEGSKNASHPMEIIDIISLASFRCTAGNAAHCVSRNPGKCKKFCRCAFLSGQKTRATEHARRIAWNRPPDRLIGRKRIAGRKGACSGGNQKK
jgi:hypothetical protein